MRQQESGEWLEWEMRSNVLVLDRETVIGSFVIGVLVLGSSLLWVIGPWYAVFIALIVATQAAHAVWCWRRREWQHVQCVLNEREARIRRRNMDDDPSVPVWSTRKGIRHRQVWIDTTAILFGRPRSTIPMLFYLDDDDYFEGAPAVIRWPSVRHVRLHEDTGRIELRNQFRTIVSLPYPPDHAGEVLDFIRRHVRPNVAVPSAVPRPPKSSSKDIR